MAYYGDNDHNYGFPEVLDAAQVRVKSANESRIIYYCPFCGDTKGKGDASITKNVFHCYKCNADGFLFELYARVMGISNGEAKKYFDEKYNRGIDTGERHVPRKVVKYTPTPEKNTAPDEQLDRIYQKYLNMLHLDAVHRENLLKRGLSEEFIEACGFKSVPVIGATYYPRKLVMDGEDLSGVTGFYRNEEKQWCIKKYGTGFYIPTRNIKGQIVNMQVRTDNANLRYYTFSSAQEAGGADMSSQMHFVGVDTSKPVPGVYLTEGALKADVAHYLSGKAFISIPGVGNFKALRQGLQSMRECGDVFKDTVIMLATDMDEQENETVRKNVEKLKKTLTEFGFRYKKLTWDPKYKGIDDFLLASRQGK